MNATLSNVKAWGIVAIVAFLVFAIYAPCMAVLAMRGKLSLRLLIALIMFMVLMYWNPHPFH